MMRKTTIEEFKRIEYNILKFIDETSKLLNIRYYLSSGTALGAVRHGGFIPWDDDIDIVMFRKDYEIFEQFMMQYKGEDYYLFTANTDKAYDYTYPKLKDLRTSQVRDQYKSKVSIGVYIDIFILDNVPSDERIRRRYLKKLKMLTVFWDFSMRKEFCESKNSFKTILKKLIRLIPAKKYALLINWYAKKYKDIDTEYVMQSIYFDSGVQLLERNWFDEGTRMQFEEDDFWLPKDYHSYLERCYGNYMKLPPVEERVNKHANSAYIINEKCLEPYQSHFELSK